MANGNASHTEGQSTIASGTQSHAEGYKTKAIGGGSPAEGNQTTANGADSHAEGRSSATGESADGAHAEGIGASATGKASHAEGNASRAEASYSHAEGSSTVAGGQGAHAEGFETQALQHRSHAEGWGTKTCSKSNDVTGHGQHVQGRFNNATAAMYAHIVGNGTNNNTRSDAHTLDWSGNAWYSGDVRVGGSNYNSGDVLATQKFVQDKVASIINSAPDTLDTLQELSKALNDDPNFTATVAESIGKKVDKTTTINNKQLSGNITLTLNDFEGIDTLATTEYVDDIKDNLTQEAVGKKIPIGDGTFGEVFNDYVYNVASAS